jgi:uncharacterized membrane protein YhaH (DUF805 family)
MSGHDGGPADWRAGQPGQWDAGNTGPEGNTGPQGNTGPGWGPPPQQGPGQQGQPHGYPQQGPPPGHQQPGYQQHPYQQHGPQQYGPGQVGPGGGRRPEPALDQPWYGATFVGAVRRFGKKYATFSGRASRSEYWWWALVYGVLALVFQALYLPASARASLAMSRSMEESTRVPDPFAFYGQYFHTLFTPFVTGLFIVWGVVSLALLVPTLALTVRRLHDVNFRGWWILLQFVPFGAIAVLVFTLLDPNPAGQRFDRPSPR